MGLGLQGALGLQGGLGAIDQILAARHAAEIEQQKRAQIELENRMKAAQIGQVDDRLAFDREKLAAEQADREATRNAPPKPVALGEGGTLIDPASGRIIASNPKAAPAPRGPVALSPGGQLVDPATGRVIASAPRAPQTDDFASWKQRYDYELAHPKAAAGSATADTYSKEHATRTRQSVDELMGKVSNWTTGVGSLLSRIPATDARNFAAELETLKGNIAFNELAAMRQASRTGGALGAVSDRENVMLSSALGALDAGQSPDNIRQQLQKIKDSLDRWEQAKSTQGGSTATPSAPPKPTAADLIKKYGGR